MTLLEIRRLTVADYHRMAEVGILDPEERVELIEGQIIKMVAKGTAHEAAITRTDLLLRNLLGNQVLLRLQSPIRLDDFSEPEPDIAVVKFDPLFYEDHHPTPDEVYLLIEVADTSLRIDCNIKAPVYARSGILDYWVLDVSDRQLHIFREPSQDSYQSQVILSDDAIISPLAFPNTSIAVRSMLRSVA
jgi:Uma2 family endonuclease